MYIYIYIYITTGPSPNLGTIRCCSTTTPILPKPAAYTRTYSICRPF